MGSFPRNPLFYFRSSFYGKKRERERGLRRSEVGVLGPFPTPLPPLAAAGVSPWGGEVPRKTQSGLAGRVTCKARDSYYPWVARLPAATWPRRDKGQGTRERQAGRPGRSLLSANCDISHAAALPGVRGQIKSPPPYDTLPKGETDTNQTEN